MGMHADYRHGRFMAQLHTQVMTLSPPSCAVSYPYFVAADPQRHPSEEMTHRQDARNYKVSATILLSGRVFTHQA